MGTRRKKEGILEKTAQVFDLPGDLVAGLPRVELIGAGELRMENHRGILAYGKEEIHISGGKLIVKVRGEDLELRSMNAGELLITGRIFGVDLN
ncbi:sporulation protein [Pseudoflavonifractor sp. 524-17]|uniref:YabP/YqfC family sporulation protein n=1 Tax=Pseudoflavonifractor sp. 524-17 TaxID=2304577 RepID=UPI0013795868|nr:YabP/YqfC family sporulation protein [Pseudoflavonifractor sp. 524-17]NCE64326.1 sporulation protein [Pseudoflavonifractor sp. 524-17]